ncbi:MAG: hypothetical protein RLZ32_2392 [Gemmatimonadota bacterium]
MSWPNRWRSMCTNAESLRVHAAPRAKVPWTSVKACVTVSTATPGSAVAEFRLFTGARVPSGIDQARKEVREPGCSMNSTGSGGQDIPYHRTPTDTGAYVTGWKSPAPP